MCKLHVYGLATTALSALNALTHLASTHCRSRCYITQLLIMKNLLKGDAESGIFQKLKMSFGQAVHFKAEFAHLNPPDASTSKTFHPAVPIKVSNQFIVPMHTWGLFLIFKK